MGLLLCAQRVIPAMKARGDGHIVVIGSTASRRGVARTAAFAPAKAAQRSLVESMARHLWPQRVHVALIIVDGVVDLPKTRAFLRDKPDEFFIQPDAVAETAYRLTTQPASAWSFEVEARPFGETW
jgi:NADP-dependent 3-hydroxy acid dehydrogenase YdfG